MCAVCCYVVSSSMLSSSPHASSGRRERRSEASAPSREDIYHSASRSPFSLSARLERKRSRHSKVTHTFLVRGECLQVLLIFFFLFARRTHTFRTFVERRSRLAVCSLSRSVRRGISRAEKAHTREECSRTIDRTKATTTWSACVLTSSRVARAPLATDSMQSLLDARDGAQVSSVTNVTSRESLRPCSTRHESDESRDETSQKNKNNREKRRVSKNVMGK